MYVKDGVTYASGDEYADMLCARGEAEMYAQSDAIAGYELALAQATAMIERQADEIARLRDENARLQADAERYRWLRARGGVSYRVLETGGQAMNEVFDAAIDAAMQKGE